MDARALILRAFGIASAPVKVRAYVLGPSLSAAELPSCLGRASAVVHKRAVWAPPLRAVVLWAKESEKTQRSLVHELAHAILDMKQMLRPLPPAIYEGFAMMLEHRCCDDGGQWRLSWARKGCRLALERGHLQSVDELLSVTTTELSASTRYRTAVFYAQAMMLVRFLVSLGRADEDWTMLAEVARAFRAGGEDRGVALCRACGQDAAEIEGGYRASCGA